MVGTSDKTSRYSACSNQAAITTKLGFIETSYAQIKAKLDLLK